MKDIFGWVTPCRLFIETKSFQHFKLIGETPELLKLVPDYDKLQSDIDDVEQGCMALADNGEHPEWHNYEIARSHANGEAIGSLYNSGAIRVGSANGTMYFEGTSEAIQNLYQFCKDLAENYGMAVKFEKRK
jgi:hypothetical protein